MSYVVFSNCAGFGGNVTWYTVHLYQCSFIVLMIQICVLVGVWFLSAHFFVAPIQEIRRWTVCLTTPKIDTRLISRGILNTNVFKAIWQH